jgi:hypothetical protein
VYSVVEKNNTTEYTGLTSEFLKGYFSNFNGISIFKLLILKFLTTKITANTELDKIKNHTYRSV